MKVLVTGSAGHLGEALMRVLPSAGYEAIGLDVSRSAFTHFQGSIVDREFVERCMEGVDVVLHAATLHKPHVATHRRQDFVDTNITGTLNLLEEAVSAKARAFVYTSTTSAFGRALTPAKGGDATWITEDVAPLPKNIYGVTKLTAENLCEMFHRKFDLPCIVLRTSRFFPEMDDNKDLRETYDDANIKVNELLYRRADIEDVANAHVCALQKVAAIGFRRYIISATTPFSRDDLGVLNRDARAVVAKYAPEYVEEYARRGWTMFPEVDRIYVNSRAREELDWHPRFDFRFAIERLRRNEDFRSDLARTVGSKGYHATVFADGPYPVD